MPAPSPFADVVPMAGAAHMWHAGTGRHNRAPPEVPRDCIGAMVVDEDSGGGFDDDASDEGFNLERVRELLGFVLNSVRRRPKIALFAFVVVAALGLTAAAAVPEMYSSQIKLLATRRTTARSPIPGMEVDYSTKNVSAMIVRRDNLVALAKEVNLVKRFGETRSPLLKLKDRLSSKMHGPASLEDKELGLVQTLEKRLDVTTDDATSTVTITVDWPDGQLAYDLVTTVSKNFLEARYDADVAMITDSIEVLQSHAKDELDKVDTELEAYRKVVDRVMKAGGAGRPAVIAQPRTVLGQEVVFAAPSATPDPEKAKALEELRQRIRGLEDAQQRTIDTLKQQLVQAQLTLTPMHPTVIALQQQLDAVSQPSPELAELRAQERALMDQIATSSGPAPTIRRPVAVPAASPASAAASTSGSSALSDAGASAQAVADIILDERDGQVQLAQSRLASAIRAYEDAAGRIDEAKIELDETLAEYKHKYTIVTPAEVPKKPKKATAQLIGAGAVVGGALLGISLSVVLEILTGLVLQSWQVRRNLKLDVLAEFDNPS